VAAREEAEIVATSDVLDGKPRVKGRRLSVRFIAEQVEGRGLAPRTVATRFDLEPAVVYRALAYYHEHPEEMAAIDGEREALLEDLAADPEIPVSPDELAALADDESSPG